MLNKRHEIAQTVANALLPAERNLDAAIVNNAQLTIAVVEGRTAARLPLTTGQAGLELVAQATANLVQARGFLAQAHAEFRKTQREIGLDAFSYGDVAECPEPRALRLVPDQRVA
ncbi:hypothetical protein V6R86_09290 [Sphingomonas kaistensis]|uniref:YbaB/EbfC family DNA-binding protein n=1 Tax=Sphingomonas kaistensis TaxID=298708 RepID=A0ABZ2G4Q7_9SPHN